MDYVRLWQWEAGEGVSVDETEKARQKAEQMMGRPIQKRDPQEMWNALLTQTQAMGYPVDPKVFA